MKTEEFGFTIYNTNFYGRFFEAEISKAVLVIVHGIGEYHDRYTDFFIPTLVENNFSVVGFDHFGHGKTGGKRGCAPSFKAVLDSISKVIDIASNRFPNLPVFLYGHSIGGGAALNYLLRRQHNLKGGIISSGLIKLSFEPAVWKVILGRLSRFISPNITLQNDIDYSRMSRDKMEVQKYERMPLVHGRTNYHFSIAFIDAGKWVLKNSDRLSVPILMLHGTSDSLIDYKGSVAFAKSTPLATLKLYDKAYHELHKDFDKHEVLQDIINWLNKQLEK